MNRSIIAIAAALLVITSCGTTRMTSEEKKRQETLIANAVCAKLDARSYEIDVDYMSPLRGGGRSVTFGYNVKVDGDNIKSYLPYVGEARSVPYGGGSGLNFEDTIDDYQDSGLKKGRRNITITTTTDEDTFVFNITVYDNTKADIRVHSRNRDDISYIGYLKLKDGE